MFLFKITSCCFAQDLLRASGGKLLMPVISLEQTISFSPSSTTHKSKSCLTQAKFSKDLETYLYEWKWDMAGSQGQIVRVKL